MLPIQYELMSRCVNIMNKCLASCNEVVSFVDRNGIFARRVVSPISRNAQWCYDTVGLPLFNIHSMSKDFVLRYVCGSLPDWV